MFRYENLVSKESLRESLRGNLKSKIRKMFNKLRYVLIQICFFIIIHKYYRIFRRGFYCSDETIQKEFHTLIIDVKCLFLFTLFLPLLVIFFVEKFHQNYHQNDHCQKCSNSIRKSIIRYLFGFMINLNFTMIVKRSIGKLRPFTYRFCNLDRYCSEGLCPQRTTLSIH